jgi:hypothetical protein
MLSVQQLRTPITRKQALDWLVTLLKSFGFDTTGWQDGRIQKTLLLSVCTLVSDLTELNKDVVEFGFNEYASGAALTLFSKSRFNNTRIAAVRTRGPMRLTSTASIPYTIEPGQLVAATDDGIEFRNVDGGVVPAGGSVPLMFEARLAGSDSLVPAGAVTRLLTSLAGVTIANAEQDPWYTVAGKDEESDASLRLRNSTKWATLGLDLVGEGYVNLALSNGAVKVTLADQNPRGAGTIDVYCAGDLAVLSDSDMGAIQLAFSKRAFHTDAVWPPSSTSRANAVKPDTQPLDLIGVVYHDPAVDQATMRARVEGALKDFLRRTPIGGWDYRPGPANVIMLGDILDVIKETEGVRTVNLSSPSSSFAVNPLKLVVQGLWSLTYTPVTT